MKQVFLLIGAGQIGMAIARRMGYGMKIVIGDKNLSHAVAISDIMRNGGFDVEPVETDLATRGSIVEAIQKALPFGELKMMVCAAGVSQAKCPAGRPGTADEVANVAELLLSDKGTFITDADFLIDGGATASYFYGPLRPTE